MEEITNLKLTEYIAVWGWQLISIIFLATFLIVLSLKNGIFTIILSTALFLIYVICQAYTLKRRNKFFEDGE